MESYFFIGIPLLSGEYRLTAYRDPTIIETVETESELDSVAEMLTEDYYDTLRKQKETPSAEDVEEYARELYYDADEDDDVDLTRRYVIIQVSASGDGNWTGSQEY